MKGCSGCKHGLKSSGRVPLLVKDLLPAAPRSLCLPLPLVFQREWFKERECLERERERESLCVRCRLFPVLPGNGRVTQDDLVVGGYYLPKGVSRTHVIMHTLPRSVFLKDFVAKLIGKNFKKKYFFFPFYTLAFNKLSARSMFLIVLNVCIVLIILLITLNLVERLMYMNNNNEIAKTRRCEPRLNAFIWSHLGPSI